MITAKQIQSLRKYLLDINEVGVPFDLAVVLAIKWLKDRQLAVTIETLQAAFAVFTERDGLQNG